MSLVGNWIGGMLIAFGAMVAVYAFAIGVAAAVAELYGVDHPQIVVLAVSALLWGAVSAYYIGWGWRLRQPVYRP